MLCFKWHDCHTSYQDSFDFISAEQTDDISNNKPRSLFLSRWQRVFWDTVWVEIMTHLLSSVSKRWWKSGILLTQGQAVFFYTHRHSSLFSKASSLLVGIPEYSTMVKIIFQNLSKSIIWQIQFSFLSSMDIYTHVYNPHT